MVAVTAAPAAPTATVSARSLDDVASVILALLETGDAIPWKCGEAVAIALEANKPAGETPDSARKRLRAMCKKLSAQVRMGTSTLVERFDVWSFYKDIDRSYWPELEYSCFREVHRHTDVLNDAWSWLDQAHANKWKAHQIKDAMRAAAGEAPTPKRETRTFEVNQLELVDLEGYMHAMTVISDVNASTLHDLMKRPGVTFTLVAEWRETVAS